MNEFVEVSPEEARFEQWRRTSYGRKIITAIGVQKARACFLAGALWSRPAAVQTSAESNNIPAEEGK